MVLLTLLLEAGFMKANNNLDQFYTKKESALKCIQFFEKKVGKLTTFKHIIEPSAGSGNILELLPSYSIGLDLDPANNKVLQQDYLKYSPTALKAPILVFGNPPFGKNCSLAIKFFNHSAGFAKYVAFIVPRTFRKISVKNRLSLNFHLLDEMILPLDSFHTPDGESYSVPTTFQIWERKEEKREKIKKVKHICKDWDWTDDKTIATHAIRRVGAKAGQIYINPANTSEPSHYYIIANKPDIENKWKQVYCQYWDIEINLNPKWDVAGNPSLSKDEIAYYYSLYKRTKKVKKRAT